MINNLFQLIKKENLLANYDANNIIILNLPTINRSVKLSIGSFNQFPRINC